MDLSAYCALGAVMCSPCMLSRLIWSQLSEVDDRLLHFSGEEIVSEGKEMCLGSHMFVSGRARIQILSLLVPRSIFFLFILKARQKRTKHKDELE